MEKRLIMFYGTECIHCHDMMPLVERLENEFNVKIDKIEVWHNAKNAELMEKLDKGFCGGVPFFFNENNGSKICGATSFENLKKWALLK